MKGSRPAQGALTEKNDLSKTDETRRVVERMADGLNAVSYTHLTLPTT